MNVEEAVTELNNGEAGRTSKGKGTQYPAHTS